MSAERATAGCEGARWSLRTAEHTEDLGAALARTLPASGDAPRVLYLSGDLGTGKTTLARGFLRALGVAGAVRSPTYTLIECYACEPLTGVHVDLYRLRDAGELEGLGLRDLARPQHVWLIEWPERAAGHGLPAPDLALELEIVGGVHRVSAEPRSRAGERWLAAAVASAPPQP